MAGNKEISLRLGQLYGIKLQHAAPEQKTQIAQKALQLDEEALGSASGEDRFVQLSDIARAALEAGDEVKAQNYAEEVLAETAQHKTSWNYGNAIHHGNLVIGQDRTQARRLGRGKSPPAESRRHSGFTPTELFWTEHDAGQGALEKHEKDVVLEYFMKCEKFWEMRGQKLAEWKTLVKQDRIPDFGGNLVH